MGAYLIKAKHHKAKEKKVNATEVTTFNPQKISRVNIWVGTCVNIVIPILYVVAK